jgi:hypothetical protein
VKPTVDIRWWNDDQEDDRARIVQSVASKLWTQATYEREIMWRNARLYGGHMPGLFSGKYRHTSFSGDADQSLSLNVVKAVCDSFTATLTKDRPKAIFQPAGADYATQKRAEALEKFTDGISYEAGLHEMAPNLVLDACIFGQAIVKLWADTADAASPQIVADRIYPWELLVDPSEAYYGHKSLKNFYHIRTVDRMALMDQFPERAEDIRVAKTNGFDDLLQDADGQVSRDRVVVVEAWHLPGTKSSKDGRRVIICGQTLLEDQAWTRLTPPFEWLYRLQPRMGIQSGSLVYELRGIQLAINKILVKIQRSLELLTGHWLVQAGQVPLEQINNRIGSIIQHKGMPPTWQGVDPISPQLFQHLNWLVQKAFENVGVSQMTAQSQKPAGLNSGRAMLVYADVQAQRFQPSYRSYQDFFLRLARQEIALAREIAKKCRGYTVKTEVNRDIFQATSWADAHMDDDEFILKMKPGNALADDPAALLEIVQGMATGGLMSPQDAGRLLAANPDLETYFKDQNASYDLTQSMIDTLLQGKWVSPEPEMNLGESIKLVQTAYLRAKMASPAEPEETLELMRRWMERAQAMLTPPAPPAPPPAPPPGAAPGPPGPPQGAPPGPPPQPQAA